MGILDRYVAREILVPFVTAAALLAQLLLATQVLAEAELLFGSGATPSDVLALAAGLLPHLLGIVLPIAFLVGTVVAIARLAEDREVIGLRAAGVSPARLLRAPLLLALAVAALAVGLAHAVEPTAAALVRERVARIVTRKLTNDIRPGVFYDQLPGHLLYAERSHGGRLQHVVVHVDGGAGPPVLALAAEGRVEQAGEGGALRLVLEAGELHRALPAADEYASATFDRLVAPLDLGNPLDRNGLARHARGASFADARQRAREERARGDPAATRTEAWYHRRLAQAFSAVPFALVGVPLGASRRLRRAKAPAAMILAVLLHYALLRTGEVLAQRGAVPPWLALQLPTLVLSGAGLALAALEVRRGSEAAR